MTLHNTTRSNSQKQCVMIRITQSIFILLKEEEGRSPRRCNLRKEKKKEEIPQNNKTNNKQNKLSIYHHGGRWYAVVQLEETRERK